MNNGRLEMSACQLQAALRADPAVRGAIVHFPDPGAVSDVPVVVLLPGDCFDLTAVRALAVATLGAGHPVPTFVLVPEGQQLDAPAVEVALGARSSYVYPFVAPAGPDEVLVRDCVAASLGREWISMSDNLLDLGGDSRTMIEVAGTIEDRTGVLLDIEEMFEAASISDLARLVTAGGSQ